MLCSRCQLGCRILNQSTPPESDTAASEYHLWSAYADDDKEELRWTNHWHRGETWIHMRISASQSVSSVNVSIYQTKCKWWQNLRFWVDYPFNSLIELFFFCYTCKENSRLTTQQALPRSAIFTWILSAFSGSRGLSSRFPAAILAAVQQKHEKDGFRVNNAHNLDWLLWGSVCLLIYKALCGMLSLIQWLSINQFQPWKMKATE